MINYPQILTIMGEGRNVGKTLLACNIIAKFSLQNIITGLKITPHKHKNTGNAKTVYKKGESILMEETDPESTKDTGRMLAAGAIKAYLLQTIEDELMKALSIFFSLIDRDSLVVIESGMLGSMNHSGISLFVRRLNCRLSDIEKKIPVEGVDRIVFNTVNGFDIDLDKIVIEKNIWKLKKE